MRQKSWWCRVPICGSVDVDVSDGDSSVWLMADNAFASLRNITINDNEADALFASDLKHRLEATGHTSIRVLTLPIPPEQRFTVWSRSDLDSVPNDARMITIADNSCNEADLAHLDLERFSSVRVVSVGSNSLTHVTSVSARGLQELREFAVAESSLENAVDFSIDFASVVSRRITIRSKADLLGASSAVTVLRIADNSCNDVDLTELDLTRFVNVRKIVIGSNALTEVTEVKAKGLIKLESLSVGTGSLVKAKSFAIDYASNVEWSFLADSKATLESAPPLITELLIGDDSCNESDLTELDFSGFKYLRRIRIGVDSLTHVTAIVGDRPRFLEEVTIGSGSLSLISNS